MRYAGISWSASGYDLAVLDAEGKPVRGPRRFDPGRAGELIAYLAAMEEPVAAVVDSTNGVIDGRLMAAGCTVYRADPEALPARPVFGAASAEAIARAAQQGLPAVSRLERRRGTQTGREDEIDAWIESSSDADAELATTGRLMSHGDRDAPTVALTFDDGPLPPYTGQVLDVLEGYGVPATFYCVGLNSVAYPDHLERIREQGHGLGNHTWSHPFLPELSRDQLAEQVGRTREAIGSASGAEPPGGFRPPYGSRTPEVLRWLTDLTPTVVLWDVAPDDWKMPGAGEIARLVLGEATAGSIVLLHDGGGDRSQTVAALPPIIEGLAAQGLRFVTVDEMAAPAGGADPAG